VPSRSPTLWPDPGDVTEFEGGRYVVGFIKVLTGVLGTPAGGDVGAVSEAAWMPVNSERTGYTKEVVEAVVRER